MSEQDSGDKQHEATQSKLDEARSKGQIVKSTELAVAAGYGGILLAASGLGAAALKEFGDRVAIMLEQADSLSSLLLGGGVGTSLALVAPVLMSVLPFFLLPLAAVLGVLLAQRALVFAPEKIRPKLSRINPIANASQKFGADGLFEFAKNTAKLVLVSLILGLFLSSRLPQVLVAQSLDPGLVTGKLLRLILEFLSIVLILVGLIGAVDYFWQYHAHLRRNRMSRQELADEMKQSEGDPHVRGQRRQRAQAIALNQMLSDVKQADVVIVNPTHYAVALRWNRASRRAPICVAKGVDEVASRIRQAAVAAGVPIHADPATARALFGTVDIGREVSPEHYAPVAAAIRYAERMRKRAKERRG